MRPRRVDWLMGLVVGFFLIKKRIVRGEGRGRTV